jgi:RND family efflux transporter MFP subunit
VAQIYVKAGDRVAVGTPLMQIDALQQQAVVASANAAVVSARADVDSARANLSNLIAQRRSAVSNLEFNQKEFSRYQQLTAEGATSRQLLDQFANNLRTARATLEAIDAQISAQQAAIARAETGVDQNIARAAEQEVQLQYFTITAPIAGVVGDIPVKVGDFVSPSSQLTTVTDNRELEVQIAIPVEKAPQLKRGLPVELLNAEGKALVKGTISFISDSINPQDQSVQVKAVFRNSSALRVGQFVNARITWSVKPNAILVPMTAIAPLAGQNFIFVAEPKLVDGKEQLFANQRPVQLGKIIGNNQEVVAGLNPNDRIITSGILLLQNGAPVEPIPASQTPPK